MRLGAFKEEKKSNNNHDAADNPFQIFNQGKKEVNWGGNRKRGCKDEDNT